MNYIKFATVTLLATGLGTFAVTASAQEPATSLNCLKMSHQVKEALARDAQSPAVQAATQEQKIGTEFCTKGAYKNGIQHFEAALKLIGNGTAASTTSTNAS